MAKRNAPSKALFGLRDFAGDLSDPDMRTLVREAQTSAIRMRNFGMTIAAIADKIGFTIDDTEGLINSVLRDINAEPAWSVAARQGAIVRDLTRALYPGAMTGDTQAAGTLIRTLDHEAKLTGAYQPQRVAHGPDRESAAATTADLLRSMGVEVVDAEPAEIEPAPGDETWSNLD